MTSLPTTLIVGSSSSSHSVRDAIESYRRSQYFVAGSQVTASSDTETFSDDEEDDARLDEEDEENGLLDNGAVTPRTRENDFLDQLDLEPEGVISAERPSAFLQLPLGNRGRDRTIRQSKRTDARPQETTPLLRKAISFSAAPHPRRQSTPSAPTKPADVPFETVAEVVERPFLPRRRSSASSAKSGRYAYGGKSTFGQTLFNCIAMLLGIGMLSEPLAFAYAGWVTGTFLIITYGFVTCYTAKILARIILEDPRLRSYADIGRKAFGQSSMLLISMLFCLELFGVSVVLVTLYADSLHTLIPRYSTTTYKYWGLIFLIPTVFLPLSLLSYTSILGILSSVLIIVVVLIDGFSKPHGPGSFWDPAETSLGVESWDKLGLAFGLFMAGFSGHAVIPSLARDMADPSHFDAMIDWAFVVATFLYALIGSAGYLMFGKSVSDEISIDLLQTPGYNPTLNQIALWMLVISPLTKFALTTQPLNVTIEILFGIEAPLAAPEEMVSKPNPLTSAPPGSLKRIVAIFQRVAVTVSSVLVSILVPEFSSVMAFLGAFAAFMLCVIGPISAKIRLDRHCGLLDGIFLASGIIMAIWGTVATFVAG
ncbi:putative transmembrane amino acid transporter protein [Lyophyllum shimeji]|uniref:Transmembrane amino acid transporter protein n=1 Tax=Lyophyllum shimeji TaxID=47721 RepID=A0A9P3PIC4_LYOSH|nr:putative transmembrane amino acid transporter protein [Lyophyllum shimeji]